MSDSVHAAARQGFEKQAAAYARGRPDHPAALLAWLRDALALGPGQAVADVGAGTGKFTPLLLATGADAVAIEPVGAMRAQIVSKQPAVRILAGTAQALALPDASLDAMVCAQSFHWFATQAALDGLACVLRPGGQLGLVWHVRDESVDWVAALTRIINPYEGDAPRFHNGAWRDGLPHPAFGPLMQTTLAHAHKGPPQQVIVDRSLSVSFMAALPAREQAEVCQRIETLIATHPALRDRAVLRFPYRTQAFVCLRH